MCHSKYFLKLETSNFKVVLINLREKGNPFQIPAGLLFLHPLFNENHCLLPQGGLCCPFFC
jgi:hypothetical protein